MSVRLKYEALGGDIAWAPDLPARWKTAPAWSIARPVRRLPAADDGIVTAFRDGEVTLRSLRRSVGFTEAVQEHGYQGVRRGELVIHSMDAFAGAIGVSDSDGKMSPVAHIYSVPAGEPRYFALLLRVMAQRGYIQSLAKGIRERSTSFDRATFRSLRLPVPSTEEQSRILRFLDRETAQIDAFIAKSENLIELLQERRHALVAHMLAVGLWSTQPARQWRVSQLATLINGFPFDAQEFESHGEVPLVRIRDLTAQRFGTFVRAWSVPSSAFIRDNDVLIGMDGDFNAVLWNRGTAALNQRVCALRAKRGLADPRFLNYSVAAPLRRINELTWSTTVKHLSTGAVLSLRVPGFTFEEQVAISDQLDIKTAEIDEAISSARMAVALASERRAALVSAAVTGKIDVTVAG